jgi:hypothetical protein
MFFNAIFFARRPYGASFVCVCVLLRSSREDRRI